MKRPIRLWAALALLLLAACKTVNAGGEKEEETKVPESPAVISARPDAGQREAGEFEFTSPSPLPPAEADSGSDLAPTEPEDGELVPVLRYIPGLFADLRYAGEDNFTGKAIYHFHDPWLRYGTVKKLKAVQEKLAAQGYSLLIWDAFRPAEAQFTLWDAVPDGRYVANPYTGHSSHSNGGTVDLALVTADGLPLSLPSGFDEFSALADREYSDVSGEAAANALLLQESMEAQGFYGYSAEWWHYSDGDAYPFQDLEALELPPTAEALYTPLYEEFISLRREPAYSAERLCKIPLGAELQVIGFAGEFLRVLYEGREGYVAAAYVVPLTGGGHITTE